MATDLYNELGVARGAKDEEIRRAYRKLAAQYHPDRNQGDEAAEQRFKRINNAYQVLSDPSKRQLYDRFGDAGLREGFKPGAAGFGGQGAPFAGGFEDIFSGGARGIGDLFADVLRGGGRGRDATGTVEVRFGDAIRGTTVELQVPGVQGAVSVRVPPGAGDGDKLRVAGKGTPGRTGAGDLLLTVKVLEHEHFRRKGLDLELEYPITVAEAVHGAKVRVPTIDGAVTLTVPVGAQSGQRVRLRGLGVKRKAEQGDLYVRFLVMVPTSNVISGPGGDALRTAAEALGRSTDLGEREKIEL